MQSCPNWSCCIDIKEVWVNIRLKSRKSKDSVIVKDPFPTNSLTPAAFLFFFLSMRDWWSINECFFCLGYHPLPKYHTHACCWWEASTSDISCPHVLWASQRLLAGHCGKQDARLDGPCGLIQQGSSSALMFQFSKLFLKHLKTNHCVLWKSNILKRKSSTGLRVQIKDIGRGEEKGALEKQSRSSCTVKILWDESKLGMDSCKVILCPVWVWGLW